MERGGGEVKEEGGERDRERGKWKTSGCEERADKRSEGGKGRWQGEGGGKAEGERGGREEEERGKEGRGTGGSLRGKGEKEEGEREEERACTL